MKNQKLAKLTREEKLKLIELLEERKRRDRLKKEIYSPHGEQRKVHASNKPIRAVFSGNGAGKTTLGVMEAAWALQGYNPVKDEFTKVPSRVVVVIDSPAKIDDVWLPELQKWVDLDESLFDKRGKPYISRIGHKNGSEILFMTHGQEPLMFESIQMSYIIFDEPPPRNLYIGLMRGLRRKGEEPKVLILGTPIMCSWMRKEIYQPWAEKKTGNIDVFVFATDANKKNLNWEFYENVFFKTLSEKELRVRRYGEFFDLSGLALAHIFNRSTHVIRGFNWPADWRCVVAIDPHPSKNHVACLLGADRDGALYYIDELSSKAPPTEFARELKEFMRGFKVIDIICDSLGATPGTGGDGNLSFLDVLAKNGVRARSTSYNDKNDEDFIQRIQQVLEIPLNKDNFGRQLPKLRIFEGNTGIISDIENVTWLKYRNIDETKPKLDISHRDYLATLKYALATHLTGITGKHRYVRPEKNSWTNQKQGKLPLFGGIRRE